MKDRELERTVARAKAEGNYIDLDFIFGDKPNRDEVLGPPGSAPPLTSEQAETIAWREAYALRKENKELKKKIRELENEKQS